MVPPSLAALNEKVLFVIDMKELVSKDYIPNTPPALD